MESLLPLLQGLTPVLQVILLISLAVIFWEPIAMKIGWRKAEEDEEEVVPMWAQTLLQHHNHDQTEQNERIIRGLDAMSAKQDKFAEAMTQQTQLLGEIVRYGVKCRQE